MKYLFFVSVFCLFLPFVKAQNFSSVTSDITIYDQPSVFTFEGYIYLNNHTFGDLNMEFVNFEQSVPAGWQTSNCLGDVCLPIGVTSGSFSLPVLSSSNFVIGHFYPNNVAGSGYIKIKLFETFFPSDTIVLTFYGVAGSVSTVDDLEDSDVQVFPNPASDFINVMMPNDEAKDLRIDIFDMFGHLVKSEVSSQSSYQLNISDLPQGVYFLRTGLVKKRFFKN
jgi:hypothetical protein